MTPLRTLQAHRHVAPLRAARNVKRALLGYRVIGRGVLGGVLLGCMLSGCLPVGPAPPAGTLEPASQDVELAALLLLVEDRRQPEPTVIRRALAGDEALRLAAARTLGRLEPTAEGEQALMLLLGDPSLPVRRAAAHSLRGRAGPGVIAALEKASSGDDRTTAILALRALGEAGVPLARAAATLAELESEELWRRLAPALFVFPPDSRADVARLGLTEAPTELHPLLGLVLTHEPTAEQLPEIRGLLDATSGEVAAAAARALGRVGRRDDLERLLAVAEAGPPAPAAAMLGAADLLERAVAAPPEDFLPHLVAALETTGPDTGDLRAAAATLATHFLPDGGIAEALVALSGSSEAPLHARTAALEALARGGEPRAVDLLVAALDDESPLRRRDALDLLGAVDPGSLGLGASDLRPLLEAAATDPHPGVRSAALTAAFSHSAGLAELRLEMVQAQLQDREPAVRASAYLLLADHPILDLDQLLAPVGPRIRREPDALTRRAFTAALESRARSERLERGAILALFEHLAENDPSHLVRRRATEALASFDQETPAPGAVHALDRLGSYRDVVARTSRTQRLRMETDRGAVEIEIECPLAPKSCLSLVQLAALGFYDGLPIADRDPGAAVHFGDPTLTGAGGPGYRLRDELTPLELDRAGIVLLDRPFADGAGSALTITLAPQPWRSGREVAVGRVVAGLDVLQRLSPGDVLRRLEVATP